MGSTSRMRGMSACKALSADGRGGGVARCGHGVCPLCKAPSGMAAEALSAKAAEVESHAPGPSAPATSIIDLTSTSDTQTGDSNEEE